MNLTKGQRTKLKILETTAILAAENGFVNLSYQAIADEIGLSQAAVIKHFPSKEELFKSVRERASQSNQDWVNTFVEKKETGKEKLIEYSVQTCNWCIANPSFMQVLVLGYYSSATDKTMQQANLQAWKNAKVKIRSFFELHYSDLNLETPKDIENRVDQVHAWVTGLAIRQFVQYRSLPKSTKLREAVENFVFLVLK
ncbi:MAG: TetR/AcrR family transcriptional regulator [Bdellovibrionota bacterium]|nr:TetR/AcrR family transcriptional regulator [Bdellovibrionota bacterium]